MCRKETAHSLTQSVFPLIGARTPQHHADINNDSRCRAATRQITLANYFSSCRNVCIQKLVLFDVIIIGHAVRIKPLDFSKLPVCTKRAQ